MSLLWRGLCRPCRPASRIPCRRGGRSAPEGRIRRPSRTLRAVADRSLPHRRILLSAPAAAPLPQPRPGARAASKERAMRRWAKFRRPTPAPHPNEPAAGTELPCIVRHFRVRVHPARERDGVRQGVRDGAPVQLQAVPAASRSLPVLQPRAGVLLQGVQRALPEREATRGAGALPAHGEGTRDGPEPPAALPDPPGGSCARGGQGGGPGNGRRGAVRGRFCGARGRRFRKNRYGPLFRAGAAPSSCGHDGTGAARIAASVRRLRPDRVARCACGPLIAASDLMADEETRATIVRLSRAEGWPVARISA